MPAKKPGSYQVRIAVRDRTSAKIGSAGQFIEVPDLNNNRLALSGIVLRATAQIAQAAAMANPPDRRFQHNSELYATLVVYNPTPNLTMQTKLFRDGKSVKSSAETAVDVTNQPDPSRMVITNVMRLTSDLEPGNYYLQVLISDKNAKDKDKQPPATQWVDFEIVK